MIHRLSLAAILVLMATPVTYAFLGRDKIESRWPEKPVQIDGRATEWVEMPFLETGGLSFRAMNDESCLYLLLRGASPDGRILLGGTYGQNVTLWFLKADGKTRDWGINLDFSHAHTPSSDQGDTRWQPREVINLADKGITPERVLMQGLEVSTTTFPPEFVFQADLSTERGRQPIYEICIPLSMIEHKGRSIDFDLVSSEISSEMKTELQPPRSGGDSKSEAGSGSSPSSSGRGGGMGGGRHGHGGGGSGGSRGGASAAELPKPSHLQLTVRLAKSGH